MKTYTLKIFLILCCHLMVFQTVHAGENKNIGKAWKSLAIQHGGRVKPFDTFSREVLKKIYGKQTFEGKEAVDVILSWLLVPEQWEKTPFILIEKSSIKKDLGLDKKLKRFSPEELKQNKKFSLQLIELQAIRQKDQDLDSHFRDLEKLETKLILYEAIKSPWLLKIKPSQQDDVWLSPLEIKGDSQAKLQQAVHNYIQLILKNYKSALPFKSKKIDSNPLGFNQDSQNLTQSLEDFKVSAFGEGKDRAQWYQESKIQAEIFYNGFKPFQLAFLFYFLFLVCVAIAYLVNRSQFAIWFSGFFVLAFLSHSFGILLRSYIMSRPPVSNMYETVVWVPWVAVVVGLIFYLKKSRLTFLASVILACLCLFLVSTASQTLDASLQPLEAVLRSSFWLSTHVLIITMSYSFFFLSFVLGDMCLISYLFKKQDKLYLAKKMSQPIYRSVQWGVFLLTVGTILGAVWADYSWGRFWGWDPKESWALISLLAYLALLHGRFAGWIKILSLSVASVLMFFLVIMAWYGVNFVLGKGLHSYGFGAGGVEYVAGFFVLHLLLCGAVLFQHLQARKLTS